MCIELTEEPDCIDPRRVRARLVMRWAPTPWGSK